MLADDRPDIRTKYDHRQTASDKVLLVADVLIRCDHDIEAGLLGNLQQFAILKLRLPLHVGECANFVADKQAANTDRDVFIKQDAQLGGFARR